jgi:hypothetical protein
MRKIEARPIVEGFLRLIPDDPLYLPSPETYQPAVALLKEMLPACDYVIADAGSLRFFERGELFMHINCPVCTQSLDEWWPLTNYQAWMNNFKVLDVTVPCCQSSLSLNKLTYEWPAGFARFAIEICFPGTEHLPPVLLYQVEAILCCKLRQVFALF